MHQKAYDVTKFCYLHFICLFWKNTGIPTANTFGSSTGGFSLGSAYFHSKASSTIHTY